MQFQEIEETFLNAALRRKSRHYIRRYVQFIASRPTREYVSGSTHRHHVLPKAKDLFPEFKSFEDHPWNLSCLTLREHFIAHALLHKAFPGSSQSTAFYNMCNVLERRNSHLYEAARKVASEAIRRACKDPERNRKLSLALRGKPKSPEHIQKMMGHAVSEEAREKLRVHNTGKKWTDEQKRRFSEIRTGQKRGSYSLAGCEAIAAGKMAFRLGTPWGEFDTYSQLGTHLGKDPEKFKRIFSHLDVIPRLPMLAYLGLENPERLSWEGLGFTRIPKSQEGSDAAECLATS